MTCIGTGASKLLWIMGYATGSSVLSRLTGAGSPLWPVPEVIMILPSRDTTELTRETPVPQDLQHGLVCRNLPLVDGSGSNRGWNWVTSPADMVLGGILLFRRRSRCVNPTGESVEGVQCPCRPLRTGRLQDEYTEYGEYGLLAMPNNW